VSTSTIPALAALQPTTIQLASGKTITLNIPSDYSITVAAQGFKSVRFMAWSPDHRLFVGELTNASDTHTGRVLVLDGFNPQTGTFVSTHTYLDNLRNPNSVAFYRDAQGQEWLYIALTDKLIRYPYATGDDAPAVAPQILATFPDFGPTAAQGGWHLTRTLAFQNDLLFVSVGSGCNSCEEPGIIRGDILEMDPDGTNSHVYASGLRNAVGIISVDNTLYATANEADHLGNDRPNDLVYKISDGANYGWPYCYEFEGTIYADTTQTWHTPYDCTKVPLAYAELEPHSAPLGLEYFDDTFADPALRDSFLVAEHGSGKPGIGTGYMISLVRSGSVTPFINGFLESGVRQGRPVDILQDTADSFFVTDDFNGAIYYLRYNH
jgi:glucose/arabinose dehydrogenase